MAVNVDVVRVFTQGDIGGNHLGIVADGVPRSDDLMQSVAAQVGFSETIFLDDTTSPPSVRIFTPGIELPFAGHPLVGIAWYLAHHRTLSRTIRTKSGDVRCGTVGDRAWIESTTDQPVRSFAGRYPSWLPDPVAVDLVEMPYPYIMWELPDAETVSRIEPQDDERWVYAYAREETTVWARFFTDEFEDPATGSAAVALARLLSTRGADSGELRVFQGEEIGHPSTIHLSWMGNRARLAGTVHQEQALVVDEPLR